MLVLPLLRISNSSAKNMTNCQRFHLFAPRWNVRTRNIQMKHPQLRAAHTPLSHVPCCPNSADSSHPPTCSPTHHNHRMCHPLHSLLTNPVFYPLWISFFHNKRQNLQQGHLISGTSALHILRIFCPLFNLLFFTTHTIID